MGIWLIELIELSDTAFYIFMIWFVMALGVTVLKNSNKSKAVLGIAIKAVL